MRSWMPWTIARNFVRAFCPTLVLLICLDMWRNLTHTASGLELAMLADMAALCVVLAMRLAPLVSVYEEMKLLIHRLWGALLMISILSVLDIIFEPSVRNLQHGLLLMAGWAFCMDVGRACKISADKAKRWLWAMAWAIACIACMIWGTIQIILQIWHARANWKSNVTIMISVLLLVILYVLFGLWAHWHDPAPAVQKLELDR